MSHVPVFTVVSVDELTQEQRTQMQQSLYGDGTCSRGNLEGTCFAAESCLRCGDRPGGVWSWYDRISTSIDHLVRGSAGTSHAGTFSGTGSTSCALLERVGRRDEFRGCAFATSLSPEDAKTLRLTHDEARSAQYVHTLCVHEGHRRRRLGARLLDMLVADLRCAHGNCPIFLQIRADGTARGSAEQTREVMLARVERLRNTYTRMGYRNEVSDDASIWFQLPDRKGTFPCACHRERQHGT